MTNTNTNALRLQRALYEEVRQVAKEEGTTINQFINVAVADRLAVLRAERWFRDRAARGDRAEFLRILESAGNADPIPDDELPSQE